MSLLATGGDASTSSTATTTTQGDASTQSTQSTQQTTATTQAAGFVDDSGAFREGWLDRLPAEFAESKQTLGKYRTLPDALKGLVEAQKLVGKRTEGMIRLPGALKENATDAEKSAHAQALSEYRAALGIPDTADKYALKPEQLPEGMTWDDSFGKTFAEIAHKNNIPPAAMNEIVGAYVQMEQARAQAQASVFEQELAKGKEALQGAWKGNFDANLKTAARVAKTLGLDTESPGLRDPNVVMALHRMAGLLSESKIVSGDFSATSTPGKDRGLAIINGQSSDPEIIRLHNAYLNGDKEVSRMVDDLLKNG